MRAKTITALFLILLFALQAGAQVKKYKAISNVGGSDINGYAYVNLTGENKDMIKFEAEGTLSDDNSIFKMLGLSGKKDPTFSINSLLVKWIVIESDTFYLNSVIEGKNPKKNIFLKKLAGKGEVKLFTYTNKKNEIEYYIYERRGLKDLTEFDHKNFNLYMAFIKCEAMDRHFEENEKIKTESPFDNATTIEAKLAVWKTLIEEYDACALTK